MLQWEERQSNEMDANTTRRPPEGEGPRNEKRRLSTPTGSGLGKDGGEGEETA